MKLGAKGAKQEKIFFGMEGVKVLRFFASIHFLLSFQEFQYFFSFFAVNPPSFFICGGKESQLYFPGG